MIESIDRSIGQFLIFFLAVPFCINSETVRVVKAARHERVELDCSMDAGSNGGSDHDKTRAKLEFRWSLNTSKDQVH